MQLYGSSIPGSNFSYFPIYLLIYVPMFLWGKKKKKRMKEKTVLGGDHQFLDRQFFLLELAIDKRKVPSSDLQES